MAGSVWPFPRLPRRRVDLAPLLGSVAAALGHVVRVLLVSAKFVPGIAGPVLIVGGIAAFDWRVALIVAGIGLLFLDRRIE